MFFHRFKTEIRENRIYLILWALTLAILSISAISFWNSEIKLEPNTGRPENSASDLLGLLIIPLIAIPIVGTITSFRQDNLKDPRAFWNTRPIRPTTLHTSKFVFLHLFFTLPLALCTFLIAINASSPSIALIYAAESALWCAGAIHLSAFASLNNHQWSKILLMPATGLIGIMITAFLVNHFQLLPRNDYNPTRFSSNLLLTTFVLLTIFAIGGIALIKNPQLRFPIWSAVLLGSLTFPLLSANWLPDMRLFNKSVAIEHTEPITDFTTSHTRHNQQHYYYLNYHLNDLLVHSKEVPINLLAHHVEQISSFDAELGIKANISSWQSGSDQFAGEKNLETIARDQKHDRSMQLTLGIGIPHDHQIGQTPGMDDIPRREITVEGTFDILAASLDDAFVIDPGKPMSDKGQGYFFSYHPALKKSQRPLISSKFFRLPLASTDLVHGGRRHHQDSPFFMRHRKTGHYFSIPGGSGGSRSGMFGGIQHSELQAPEGTSFVKHDWRNKLQKKLLDFPDYDVWKKDADLLVLPSDQLKSITVPFKVTIALPDLAILQERLNKLPE